MADRNQRQTRAFGADLKTREDGGEEMIIEGYFAVFNVETELWPGAYEELAPEAFSETMSNDVRALINHDTTLVLGRNKVQTLSLSVDQRGLLGRIKVNPADGDAVNLYERVKRGDVDQCSFGFNILGEEVEFREDGTVKWRITKVDLHEVSVCTFPAYEATGVQARHKEVEQHQTRKLQQRKNELKARLRK